MAGVSVSLLIFGILLQAPSRASTELTFNSEELYVPLGDSGIFTVTLNNKIEENATVKFWVVYPELAKTDPTQIILVENTTYDEEVIVYGLEAGNTLIVSNVSSSAVKADNAFLHLHVVHFYYLVVISEVVGWIYFVAWSVSFYPQLYENWKRKSVVGLNFDFLALNFLGFSLYSLFNCGLYWIPIIREEYLQLHERSAIPVKINDIFFSLHAAIITLVTISQCFFYERGGQRVSIIGRTLLGGFMLFLTVSLLCSVFNVLSWLNFLYFCSYVKLAITLIKYVPQVYMNYQRKSTIGWSIGNVLLDFTGGILSMLQMFLDAYNYNDWSSFFGDPTKFGLGLFSVVFDILFVVQHYILYRNCEPYQPLSDYDSIDGLDSSVAEADVNKENQSNHSRDAASSEFVT